MTCLAKSTSIDSFLSLLAKGTFPDQKIAIRSSCCKEITLLWKFASVNSSIMTVHGIDKTSLFEGPDFGLSVWRNWNHKVSRRVNRDIVYAIVVGCIMLNKFFDSQVMDLNGFRSGTGSYPRFERMESGWSDCIVIGIIFENVFLFLNVPDEKFFVFSSGTNHGHVLIDFSWVYPVVMAIEVGFEF